MMNKIPLHRRADQFDGEIAILRHMNEKQPMPKIDYVHRDDYYVFIFVENGKGKMEIDFVKYEISGSGMFCILPGQVHFPIEVIFVSGWALAMDSVLVKEEYKDILERSSRISSNICLSETIKSELKTCLSFIERRFIEERDLVEETILHDLISLYVGMFTEVFQKGFTVPVNNRLAALTYEFKSLLSKNYQSLKRPAEYASCLHISPVYLNEAVKSTTGLTVGECIRNEIVLQAKRLLYYTDLNVKEIALELGYEDWAYFTRLFTKISGTSPTQFRKQYLK